jgi:hypothetical protein
VRVMLGALTFSMVARSLGVLGRSSSRTSTENWCGATSASLSRRTRRAIRMQAIRRSLVSRSRWARVIGRGAGGGVACVDEGATGAVMGLMVVSSGRTGS